MKKFITVFLAVFGFSASTQAQDLSQAPDIAGISMNMSMAQVKARINAEYANVNIDWMKPYPMTMARSKATYGYSSSPLIGRDLPYFVEFDTNERMLKFEFKQTVKSNKPLSEILRPAVQKYGKPFEYSEKPWAGNERIVMFFGARSNGVRLTDKDGEGRALCIDGQNDEKPNCSWYITISAERKPDSGVVAIGSTITSPALIRQAQQRAEGVAAGGARF